MSEEKTQVTISNKNLIESLHYLKQEKFLQDSASKIKFETVKEAEDNKIEEVVSIIVEKTNQAKQDISQLQKAGYNLHLETIKLIEIPLKTKVWKATLLKKDLEIIFNKIKEVYLIIDPLKIKNEKDIAEKERLEKEKDQKEKEENEAKRPTINKTTPTPSTSQTPPKQKSKTP